MELTAVFDGLEIQMIVPTRVFGDASGRRAKNNLQGQAWHAQCSRSCVAGARGIRQKAKRLLEIDEGEFG
jgi:hypothetical protein